MKKRILELLLVIACVAVVVVLLKPDSGVPPELPEVSESPVARRNSDKMLPVPGPRMMVEGPPSEEVSRVRLAGNVERASLEAWEARYREALAFLGQGANDRAEASLNQALDLAPQAGLEALARTLDAMALVKYRQGQYESSVLNQKQAIALLQSSPDAAQHQATIADYESRLAQALQAQGREVDALAALERSRLAYRAAYAPGSPAFADSMRSLANLHRSFGDNDGAARLLEE